MEQTIGVFQQVLDPADCQDDNALFLASQVLFFINFLSNLLVMLLLLSVEVIEVLFVKFVLLKMSNLVVDSHQLIDLILSNTTRVFNDCWSQFEGFLDEVLQSFLHQIVAFGSFSRNELIKLEALELDFCLAFDHDNEGVGILVEKLLINFWFEVIDLIEVDPIQFDEIIELFFYYSVDSVLQGFLDTSLLITVVTCNINDLLLILIQYLGKVIISYVGGREDVFVDFLQRHSLRENLDNGSILDKGNQGNLLKQMRILNILLLYEDFDMLRILDIV